MNSLTPREIVSELDRHIVGQHQAKRMVAIAMRNRWRRQQLDPALRDDIAPKNILMIGPTGVGKTEIARRLAKLSGSPFHKVEATKFTEVGYVGRDVESMVRDLMELGVRLIREEEAGKVRIKAETAAEERLLDLLLPPMGRAPSFSADAIDATPGGTAGQGEEGGSTRDKLKKLWRKGLLDDKQVEMEVIVPSPTVDVMAMPGMEELGSQFKDMFSKVFPQKRKARKLKVREAYEILIAEESEKLVDMDKVAEAAKERVEQTGILFIDEIDKICGRGTQGGSGPDVSREGVQRDLLPVVEGCVVNTKYGMVRTDHILFIAAGAFHFSKPSDLVPELQGRFPLRAELSALGREEFLRILTEPQNSLTVQYTALLATEGVTVEFPMEGLEEVAAFAQKVNDDTENIGARRLYTIMEKIVQDLSFDAPDRGGETVVIDREYVREKLKDVSEDPDLTRYIL
ncbi:MAG: ATP-dependent protease ATPase subunit HslU [Acidobacteriota bacterium]